MQDVIPRERYKTGGRDYTDEIIRPPAPTQSLQEPEHHEPKARKHKKHRDFKKLLLYLLVLILVIVAAIGGWWRLKNKDSSPVPKDIQKSVSFPIYYPDPKKLPTGYILDLSSFNIPAPDVVVYTVDFGQGKKITFSVQKKPSQDNLDAFSAQRIPLHTTQITPVGTALIGAIGNQSVTSLPTTGSAWIIITGPYAINQNQFEQVLDSLKS